MYWALFLQDTGSSDVLGYTLGYVLLASYSSTAHTVWRVAHTGAVTEADRELKQA